MGGSKFDLIVADLPEGLLVPNVSSPPQSILDWNKHNLSHIEALFEFTYAYLIDNVCMLIIMIRKFKVVRWDVMIYTTT